MLSACQCNSSSLCSAAGVIEVMEETQENEEQDEEEDTEEGPGRGSTSVWCHYFKFLVETTNTLLVH